MIYLMKLFLDFLPLLAFFVSFKLWGIYTATVVAIVLAFFMLVVVRVSGKTISPTLWLNSSIVVVMGSLTIFFHNEWFIKWKPTMIYLVFAGILFFGHLTEKAYFKKLFGENLMKTKKQENTVTLFSIGFFLFLGLLNVGVAYSVSTEAWVTFKVFGLLLLTLLYGLSVGLYLVKSAPEQK